MPFGAQPVQVQRRAPDVMAGQDAYGIVQSGQIGQEGENGIARLNVLINHFWTGQLDASCVIV